MASVSNAQLTKFLDLYRSSVKELDVDAIEKHSLTLKRILIAEGGNSTVGESPRAHLFREIKAVHEEACAVVGRLSEMVRSEIDSGDSRDRVNAYVTTQIVSGGA